LECLGLFLWVLLVLVLTVGEYSLYAVPPFRFIVLLCTIDCYLFWTYKMSSPTNSINSFYGLFKSHLLGVLALPEDSPPIRALMEGAGINLLINFLLQPPSYCKDELTYIEVREDGSTILMALHPTYVSLLKAFYWWCHSYIEGSNNPLLHLSMDYPG